MLKLTATIALVALCWACAHAQPTGIAARYPGDRGIAKDPRVLLAEDFETGTLADVAKRWTEASNQDGRVLELVDDAPPGSGGHRCLRITSELGRNTGGHLYKRLPREVDTLYARFYVKFAEDAEYVHHFVHIGGYHPATNWPQGGAGERPRGDDRITVGIEPFGDYGKHRAPGAWNYYAYWQEMRISGDGRYWGNSIAPAEPPLVPKGRWQCVEVMVKLNSAPDKADGALALWLDGKLAMRVEQGTKRAAWTGLGFRLPSDGGAPFEGFCFRSTTDLKLNFFWLMLYVTENAARQNSVEKPNPINRVWFDNVVVATEYVGPIAK